MEDYLADIHLKEAILLETVEDDYFEERFYQTNNLQDQDLKIFLSSSDAFFMEGNLLKSLAKFNGLKDHQEELLENIMTLKKDGLGLGNYSMTMNFVPFFRFMKSRQISLGPFLLNLNKRHTKKYYDLILEGLSSSSQENFYVLDPNYSGATDWDFNLFTYLTDHYFVTKKLDFNSNSHYKYIVSTDPDFIKILQSAYEQIHKAPYIKKTSLDHLKNQIISYYRSMVLLDESNE